MPPLPHHIASTALDLPAARPLGVLPDDPHHGRFGVRLVQTFGGWRRRTQTPGREAAEASEGPAVDAFGPRIRFLPALAYRCGQVHC